VFVFPFSREYLSLVAVDLYDRAGADQRVHRKVIRADDAVNGLSQIELLNETNRNLSPDFNQTRQQAGLVQMQILAGAKRHFDGLNVVTRRIGKELSLRTPEKSLIPAQFIRVHPKERKNVRPARLVDCSESIKTSIADSLNVVVHVERRPGRRYISEVLVINGYDPDADLFDYATVFLAKQERP
jgi:hypothetical protein